MTEGQGGPVSSDSRKMKMASAIQQEVIQGGRVETQSDFSAIIRFGKPVNHTLHLILTLVTCGVWGLVWLALWIMSTNSQKTITLTVDEFGNVLRQQV